MREGLVLVIDEADKAPTNVTCVLKTLVESGQMHLSDGRKIVSGEFYNYLHLVTVSVDIVQPAVTKTFSSSYCGYYMGSCVH